MVRGQARALLSFWLKAAPKSPVEFEILDAKSEALVGQRRATQSDLAAYAAREVASFWLTHALHSSLALLRHLFESRRVHPEQVYAELARLGGALCTFSLDSHPRALPLYDHDHLEECFGELERHNDDLRQQLEWSRRMLETQDRVLQRLGAPPTTAELPRSRSG